MTGGKIVARVLGRIPDGLLLAFPANLTFPIEPLDGGQRFAVKASLMGMVGVDSQYVLPLAGVRGYIACNDSWLKDVHGRFQARAEKGEFRLNPYAKPETALLMQGKGDVEAEEIDLPVINADPAPTNGAEAPSA